MYEIWRWQNGERIVYDTADTLEEAGEVLLSYANLLEHVGMKVNVNRDNPTELLKLTVTTADGKRAINDICIGVKRT